MVLKNPVYCSVNPMHPRYISIKDFTYHLPDESIAKYPLAQRDASRLLVYDGQIKETQYKNIASQFPEGSLMVFNNTRVIEARILFEKQTGGRVELFCLEPGNSTVNLEDAMLQKGTAEWLCLIGGAKKWKQGLLEKTITVGNSQVVLQAEKTEALEDCFKVRFTWNDDSLSFAALLHEAGVIPLPPYLHRQAEANDSIAYQTVYAAAEGSVAAPTAGLHFTDTVLQSLENEGIGKVFITLHVGAGTFKPVKADKMEDHQMHAEWIDVPIDFIQLLQKHNAPVVCVGTTVCRTIETLYHTGYKIYKLTQQAVPLIEIKEADIQINQWDPYEPGANTLSKIQALNWLIDWCIACNKNRLIIPTRIIIAPGYQFQLIDGLVTNFHQPESTLLLLVAAITGEGWRTVYDYALNNGFRFLSYGDGSLLWKKG